VDDLGKIAVIAGIFGAILLAGILMAPTTQETAPTPAPEPVIVEETVTVLQEDTLEMLDPIYSEKAVFQDGVIRISFDASYSDEGLQSRLPFWVHNISGDVINILWDRCSLQLPGGNTVKIVNEESGAAFGGYGNTISIAPSGDLFDAIIPVSERVWEDEGGWSVTTGVLDRGPFTLVLAVEHGELRPCLPQAQQDICNAESTGKRAGAADSQSDCDTRCITYYTFRFIVR
jgi:hypothetical protein